MTTSSISRAAIAAGFVLAQALLPDGKALAALSQAGIAFAQRACAWSQAPLTAPAT